MKTSEALTRIRETAFLASGMMNLLRRAVDTVAPTDYGRAYRQVRRYTMSSNARLRALHAAVEQVMQRQVPGDIVECGTARGGSAALMGLALQRAGDSRRLWVFDTFEGMPEANANDPDYEHARHYTGSCRGELAEVRLLFDRLGLLERTSFVQGLFQDTLPRTATGPISVLHLDGDWYDSVMVCLERLYDQVSPGGIIQVDDYGYWAGARKAVDDFFRQRGIAPPLQYVDYSGRQFSKP